jgi:hypothetical protein
VIEVELATVTRSSTARHIRVSFGELDVVGKKVIEDNGLCVWLEV